VSLPPALVIRVSFESETPVVYVDHATDADAERFRWWLADHPKLLRLVEQAL
jgi:hypothetical protein